MKRLADLLRTWADRLDPPEPAPDETQVLHRGEWYSYTEFLIALKAEHDAEVERPRLRVIK